jgi:serine O-acetyltransferase
MIRNKADYKRFLRIELKLGEKGSTNFFKLYCKTIFKPEKRFILLHRICEFHLNTGHRFMYYIVKYLKYKHALKLGFSIPENVADEGLQLPHYGTIIINKNARLGKHCRIHACVNIGASGGSLKGPQIGDYVYFAPGAKVYGDIQIASRIAIAANAAVGKSFLTSDKLIGGIPAKEITDIDIHKIIKTYK